jgi:ABC-2 type transport system ATP-binding protein
LRLESLGKSFRVRGRDVLAVDAVSLSLDCGQLSALTGPNGSGKTTILRIVATLVLPSSGRGLVFDHDVVTEPAAVRRSIGVSLGAVRSFYWRLTAGHNLAFFARLKGIAPSAISREVRRIAAELDLERFLRAPVRNLSCGTLARLSVARACLGGPSLLLLDEPFASVDGRARELVWDAVVRRLRRGAAAVLSTHDADIAARCNLAVELDGGRAAT